jgi:hypothetical protein
MMRNNGRSILRVLAHHGIGAVIALGLVGAVAGAHATTVKVKPDEATMVRLAERPATVVVGNPLYADVIVVGDKVLVQGHNYGKTNVIVMNSDGRKIAAFDVVVTGGQKEHIVVFRGGKRTTMLCAPDCNEVADTANDSKSMENYAKKVQMREAIIKGNLDR